MTYNKEIEEAFLAFEALKNARNLDGKIAVLHANEENAVMKNLLQYTYNTFKQYYIKQISATIPASDRERGRAGM